MCVKEAGEVMQSCEYEKTAQYQTSRNRLTIIGTEQRKRGNITMGQLGCS